jgi:S-DNA-T family DNA segregation ATPase FtsK/SpoIIIE
MSRSNITAALNQHFSATLERALALEAEAQDLARRVFETQAHLVQAESERIESHFACDGEQLRQRAGEATATASAAVHRTSAALTSGAFGAKPGYIAGSDTEAVLAGFVRVGSFSVEGGEAPLLAPFLNYGGLFLQGAQPAAQEFLEVLIARVVQGIPLNQLTVDVFDPNLSGLLANFAGLRRAVASAFPPVISDQSSLNKRLAAVVAQVSGSAELLRMRGVQTVADLWASGGTLRPYRVVVLADYPRAFSADEHSTLVKLASGGPNRGVSLVVLGSPSTPDDLRFDPAELISLLTTVSLTEGAVRVDVGSETLHGRSDGAIDHRDILRIVDSAGILASGDQGPNIALSSLIRTEDQELWSGDATDGLSLPIGKTADGQNLILQLKSENPPLPNMLIGGAVGQGKSNLLLSIIYAMTATYGPDQVELQLLDFKQGLEFKKFDADRDGKNWLVHATVISLESDRAFGLAVLRDLMGEFDRRAQLFKAAGVSGYSDYRRTGASLPRRVLIIDEFQVLFDGDDEVARAATELLTNAAKLGRAYGVHLILSSQTLSGIRGLAAKLDSIFAQFPVRIALKNTASESQTILGQGNTAAATLKYRGEVIFNQNYGMDPEASNIQGNAAFADQEFTAQLQETMWQRQHNGRPPLLFLGSSAVPWEPALESGNFTPPLETENKEMQLVLGQPVSVDKTPLTVSLRKDFDQNVAVVGATQATLSGVLAAAACSAIVASSVRRVLVLAVEDGSPPPWLGTVESTARRQGTLLEVVPARDAAQYLLQRIPGLLESRTRASDRMLVIVEGAQRVPGLFDEVNLKPDDLFGSTTSAAAELRRLFTEGPMKNVFSVATWNSLASLERTNGFDHAGVGTYVLVDQNTADLKRICGFDAERPEGSPRFVLHQRNSNTNPVVAVPFALPEQPVTGGS